MLTKRLPQRPSLLGEVTDILRESIVNGRWKERLPGERLLASELQVSRPTIGLALKALEKEGMLSAGAKKKRIIIQRTKKRAKVHKPVVLISPVPLEHMEQHTVLWVDVLRQYLAKLNVELLVRVSSRVYSRGVSRLLEQLVTETPACCWVLTLSTREMQQWFWERKLPTVVTGSCFHGYSLHSVDLDFRAVGRHAAGMLLSRNHPRSCLVIRTPIRAGDKLTELGFCEVFERSTSGVVPPLLVHHDGSPEGIANAIDRIFRRANPPTAYFVTNANHVIAVISRLAQHGQILGRDYALISRDDDAFLSYIFPTIPCYKRDHARFSRAALRLIQRMIDEPSFPTSALQIMPDFRPGEALTSFTPEDPPSDV